MNNSINLPHHSFEKERYERKYLLDSLDFSKVERLIRSNPAKFRPQHPTRYVNTIYLDTHNFRHFMEKIDGAPAQGNYRVRWHGSLLNKATSAALEYKYTQGLAGKKMRFPLVGFKLHADLGKMLRKVFTSSHHIEDTVKQEIFRLMPVVLVRYLRHYYLSLDGRFRLTLDSKLSYCRVGERNVSYLGSLTDHKSLLIELKYPYELDTEAKEISNHFSFRLKGFSKYTTGIMAITNNKVHQ